MYHNIRFQHDLTKQFFYGSHQSTDQNTNRIIIKDIDWEESAEEGWINTGQSYLHRRDYISPNKVSHIPQSQLITESIRYALNSTRILHTGRAFGSVHPQHPAYRSSLDTVMKNLNISRLILPRLFAIEVTEITNLEHQSLENQDLEKQNLAQQNLDVLHKN